MPIFQEQVMQVAMLAAGFTAGEAAQLRANAWTLARFDVMQNIWNQLPYRLEGNYRELDARTNPERCLHVSRLRIVLIEAFAKAGVVSATITGGEIARMLVIASAAGVASRVELRGGRARTETDLSGVIEWKSSLKRMYPLANLHQQACA